MRKVLLLVLVTVMALMVLTACGGQTASPGTAPPDVGKKPTQAAPKSKLNYATNSTGTAFYTFAAGQGQYLTNKANIQVNVQPTAGPLVIPGLLKQGGANLGILSGYEAAASYNGTSGYKEAYPELRILMAGPPLLFAFITHKGTGIKSVSDFKGKRITYLTPTSPLLSDGGRVQIKAYGLDPERDIKPMKMEFPPQAMDELINGRTDVVFGSLGGGKLEEVASKLDTFVVPVEEKKVKEIQKEMPAFFPAKAPAGLPKVVEGTPIIGTNTLLVASSRLDDATAYLVVKTLLEGYQDLLPLHRDFKGWSKENAVKWIGLPYHPGAIKYFREQGMWGSDMSKAEPK